MQLLKQALERCQHLQGAPVLMQQSVASAIQPPLPTQKLSRGCALSRARELREEAFSGLLSPHMGP